MEKTDYTVLNMMSGEYWEGKALNAKEAYTHIVIKPNDTTVLNYGSSYQLTSVKEW